MDPIDIGFRLEPYTGPAESWSYDDVTHKAVKTEKVKTGWVIVRADGSRQWASSTEIMLWAILQLLTETRVP